MANMLIRTSVSKYKFAVLLRIVFFIGIPAFYFCFLRGDTTGIKAEYDIVPTKFSSRSLLSLPGEENCTKPAILEFPPDGFTRYQRRHGFIAVHCVLAVYCFLLLGTVCEQYFVPTIKIICERLNMASDIAGATFMAAASSSPELFINCVGTFVTEGDLGVGAVVGSAVFNVLAVPACCALVAGRVIELDWWSVSRDCMMYAVAVVALILSLLDDKVYWHEALLLVLMYTLYILAMVFNGHLGRFARSGCCINRPKPYTEVTPLLIKDKNRNFDLADNLNNLKKLNDMEKGGIELRERRDSTDSDLSVSSVWSWPDEKTSLGKKLLWVLTWPICLLLWATIPDCRRHQNLYPVTFIMCITWIGGVSYLVAWIITILGDTLDVPDSITGLTILAAGTSLPEAVSSVLVTNQGHGTMGISNSIGSNTFDILLCLGLPWLIKSLCYPTEPGNHWVRINSSGLSYSAISLLSTLIIFYASLAFNKFQLDWKIGISCALIYFGFLVFATLIELNMFFVVNLPTCAH
ncbi:sodium/potassium/calcium exchanger 4-like [Aricia agestis]|uniref:sodium/potassium/calcium exchanger 4-like n=1 Tax=Aricia agestis TaxID=91739 RepID=UPI001C2032E8|nr:sodium/potassium/calcium exchanger 4-like [Aricia agestis]